MSRYVRLSPPGHYVAYRTAADVVHLEADTEAAAEILWGFADGGGQHRLYGRKPTKHDDSDAYWLWTLDDRTIARFLLDLRAWLRDYHKGYMTPRERALTMELIEKLGDT